MVNRGVEVIYMIFPTVMKKISHRILLTAIAAGLIFTTLLSNSAEARGRYILNQTPQTIERYFGRYWTRLTRTENGVTRVTYTYSPAALQRIFPNTQISSFAITFINNRAQQISLNISGAPDPESFTYGRAEASRLYEYIFGYRPSIWQQISSEFTGNETIYDYEYCLGDGVATRFTLAGWRQFLQNDAELYYSDRCEPPYNR
jgi:hypothetical protein